jgi:hypothetical protein
MPTRPYSIPGALLIALVTACTGLLAPATAGLPFADVPASVAIRMFVMSVILGVPFAYWLPIVRAEFFGGLRRVPSQTLLLPRLLVCLKATMTIGAGIGMAVLGIVVDYQYLILGLWYMLFSAAFTFSAVRRFRHHPATEFVIPSPFSFSFRGRM